MIVLVFLGIDVVGTDGASAHSAVKSSTPAAGSVVAAPPASVTLTFDDGILSMSVTVIDGCGRTVPAQVSVRDRKVQAALRPGDQVPASGRWSLQWNAVGADGHPISGAVPFTVSGTADCAASGPQPAGSSAAAGNDSNASATASANGPAAEDTDEVAFSASPSLPVGVLVALAVVLLGAGAAVLARRGRSPPAPAREKS